MDGTEPNTPLRECRSCGRELPITDFYLNGKYRRRMCKRCVHDYNLAYYHDRVSRDPHFDRDRQASKLEARNRRFLDAGGPDA